MALLVVEGVSKSFGALKAVDDVSFTVEAGEIFGLAGPNGSGKSTLFNILTGIPFGPDRGRISFDGVEIHAMSGHRIARLGLARSFQRETSFESLSVWENAVLGAAYGHGSGSGDDTVAEALSFVGLDREHWGRPSNELSVYDRKALMLAAALAMQPRMLLLDEPAAGLTKPEVDAFILLVRRIAERGITIVLTEHILTFLMSLSQRLLVLNQGQILTLGLPDEVMRDPRVVEAYLGSRRHDS